MLCSCAATTADGVAPNLVHMVWLVIVAMPCHKKEANDDVY